MIMKTKHIICAGLCVAIGVWVAIVLTGRQSIHVSRAYTPPTIESPPITEQRPTAEPVGPAATAPDAPSPAEPEKAASKPATKWDRAKAARNSQPLAPQNAPGAGQKPPAVDPLAREALGLVGIDPAAEAYWMDAINNPDLPEEERKDLIEDLNEDGLSDPKHPTIDDLPLIVRRIRIIEKLGPSAMDRVNAAAFEEALKDLEKMYAKLTQ
jgi:hypothetical protein